MPVAVELNGLLPGRGPGRGPPGRGPDPPGLGAPGLGAPDPKAAGWQAGPQFPGPAGQAGLDADPLDRLDPLVRLDPLALDPLGRPAAGQPDGSGRSRDP